mgnify:CR=1 FL=1
MTNLEAFVFKQLKNDGFRPVQIGKEEFGGPVDTFMMIKDNSIVDLRDIVKRFKRFTRRKPK